MTSRPTRRRFLELSGTAAGMAGVPVAAARHMPEATSIRTALAPPRPKIAALASTYYYLSHAYHIVGRFLDGFVVHDGHGLHKPPFDIASLFIEQVSPATDLGRAHSAEKHVRLSPTIADALTLGTGKLAVDGVLLIAEHGDYPFNGKLQKLYPRGRFFREVLEVIRASGSPVPVFIDKHLSFSRAEASEMLAQAKALKVPLMAGSSLPVTWRFPALEIPLDRNFKDVLVASRGDLEIYGFHALETLQCMVERRRRNGKPQGVSAVTCLEGDAVWAAGDRGVWSWELLERALGRSHTRNVGDIKQNTRDFMPPKSPGRDEQTKFRHPVAFIVEYVDGLRADYLDLERPCGRYDVRGQDQRFKRRRHDRLDTDVFTRAPGACFFDPLVLRIEDLFRTRMPPYPVERTLLTGGILDVALESRIRDHRRIETPELAAIDYQPPADSGFIRTPLTSPEPNRL